MKKTILAVCFALATVMAVTGTAYVVQAGTPWVDVG
jgi:hypothetical protein